MSASRESDALQMKVNPMWNLFLTKIPCFFCVVSLGVISLVLFVCMKQERRWRATVAGFLPLVLLILAVPRDGGILASEKDAPAQGIVASVGGRNITADELDRPVAARIYDLENEIYQLRLQRLNEMIVQILLTKEAERRGVNAQQLVDEVILAGGVEVSAEELEQYYRENRGRWTDWKGSEEELRKKMSAFLGQKKGYRKVYAYGMSLKENYGVNVYLQEPPLPSARVSVGSEDPVFGGSSAPVTVVEFSDYQCDACRQTHEVVKKIRGMYSNSIKWVFKDFPVKGHAWAQQAAEAARCANEQGKFWEYQDLLFASDQDLNTDQLMKYAAQVGLKMDSFRSCCESRKYRAAVEKDFQEGANAGVGMTPTFIVNDKMIPGGPSVEVFRKVIDKELSKGKEKS